MEFDAISCIYLKKFIANLIVVKIKQFRMKNFSKNLLVSSEVLGISINKFGFGLRSFNIFLTYEKNSIYLIK